MAKKAIDYVKEEVTEGPDGKKLVHNKGEYKLRAPLPSKGNKIAMVGANFYDHSVDAYKMLRGDTTTVEELKNRSSEESTDLGGSGNNHVSSVIQVGRHPTQVKLSDWITRWS